MLKIRCAILGHYKRAKRIVDHFYRISRSHLQALWDCLSDVTKKNIWWLSIAGSANYQPYYDPNDLWISCDVCNGSNIVHIFIVKS